MKTNKKIKEATVISIIFFATSVCFAQFFPGGGYQGGSYGSGGDETYQIFLAEPRGFTATGGDGEVFLDWDKPFPLGEINFDDGTAEAWYYLSDPSSVNDMFYVRFETPVTGKITDIAVLNGADSDAYWEEILICPDDGTGKPDITSPWETFPSVDVNTSPIKGGEWEILNLSTPQSVINRDTFYIVTRWPNGLTAEPFLATDTDSNSGRSAWTMDGGVNWTSWSENFIMRAYITDSYSKGFAIKSEGETDAAYLPVISIEDGKRIHYKTTKIAASIRVPELSVAGDYDLKGLIAYSIYRSEIQGGTYDFLDSETGLSFVDNTVSNNTEYFYVVTTDYDEGESDYSNEATAYPQEAAIVPFSNNFDSDNGNFYGKDDWEWGIPSYVNGPSAFSSPNVWGTVLAGDYNNLSYSWLVRPFDLSSPAAFTLNFAYWNNLETGFDYGYLAIDHNYDGIYYVINTYNGDSEGWQLEDIIIPDSLCTAYSRIAFILDADFSNTDAGFYIDNLSIERYINVDLTLMLEGPYNGSNMNTDLNTEGLIPLSQPYDMPPWNYYGTDSVVSIPNPDIVDWVLVELRDTTDAVSALPECQIARQAAFLLNDGSVVDLDGSSILTFNHSIIQSLFVMIWHRNHLSVLSANPLPESGGLYIYDYSSGELSAYGGSLGHKNLGSGVYGMFAGDANSDNIINIDDKNNIWNLQAGNSNYLNSDLNLDSQADNNDKDDIWQPNINAESQVPE